MPSASVNPKDVETMVSLNAAAADSTPLHARRAQHAKHHGCVTATFRLNDDIPQDLRIGLFHSAGSYPAYVRFSNSRATDDRGADAHGMAIKVLDVEGEPLLPGADNGGVQDFLLIDSETFFTGRINDYLFVSQGLLDRTRSLFSKLMFWLDMAILRTPLLMAMVKVAGQKPCSPLGSTYYSAVPYQLGVHVVKYLAKPCDFDTSLRPTSPGGLGMALRATLARSEVSFDFGVDVQTDPGKQPIEDPTVPWSRATGARRVWIGRITIPAQDIDANAALAENLAFSPWHALADHRPLGAINEARREVYQQLAIDRHRLNKVSPADTAGVPTDNGPAFADQ